MKSPCVLLLLTVTLATAHIHILPGFSATAGVGVDGNMLLPDSVSRMVTSTAEIQWHPSLLLQLDRKSMLYLGTDIGYSGYLSLDHHLLMLAPEIDFKYCVSDRMMLHVNAQFTDKLSKSELLREKLLSLNAGTGYYFTQTWNGELHVGYREHAFPGSFRYTDTLEQVRSYFNDYREGNLHFRLHGSLSHAVRLESSLEYSRRAYFRDLSFVERYDTIQTDSITGYELDSMGTPFPVYASVIHPVMNAAQQTDDAFRLGLTVVLQPLPTMTLSPHAKLLVNVSNNPYFESREAMLGLKAEIRKGKRRYAIHYSWSLEMYPERYDTLVADYGHDVILSASWLFSRHLTGRFNAGYHQELSYIADYSYRKPWCLLEWSYKW